MKKTTLKPKKKVRSKGIIKSAPSYTKPTEASRLKTKNKI